MPIKLDFDRENRIIILDVSGETSTPEWQATIAESFKSTGNEPGWNVLIDVRDHKTVAPSQIFWELSARFKPGEKSSSKWAIVVSRVVSEGISNMLSTLVSDSGIQVKAFKSREDAEAWLKKKEEKGGA